jgi:threonine dehydratase
MTPGRLEQLEAAAALVRAVVPPTPQICWPLLCERTGSEVWVKHENHTSVGAFKLRGGVVYLQELIRRDPSVSGVIAATRGNHGQSIALAAQRAGLAAVIVVPHGNSTEKNAAMRAFGAQLIVHGADYQEALEHSMVLARTRQLQLVPPFDDALLRGVASYALELFRGAPPLDAVYVPIGMGSGICGMIAVRDALRLGTEVIGVVAAGAPAYAASFAAGKPVSSAHAQTIADGMACRVPEPQALAIMLRGAARIVSVEEQQIRAAMRALFSDTHNVAEGAGAAGLAALLKERARMRGKRVAIVLSGGNVDRETFAQVLAERD